MPTFITLTVVLYNIKSGHPITIVKRGVSYHKRGPEVFLSSAHTSPAHLSVIGGDFVLESVVRCAVFVCYSEFGGCPLFGSIKCTASTGIAVGTSTVVRYSEEVRYWEGPLSEVPLYYID